MLIVWVVHDGCLQLIRVEPTLEIVAVLEPAFDHRNKAPVLCQFLWNPGALGGFQGVDSIPPKSPSDREGADVLAKIFDESLDPTTGSMDLNIIVELMGLYALPKHEIEEGTLEDASRDCRDEGFRLALKVQPTVGQPARVQVVDWGISLQPFLDDHFNLRLFLFPEQLHTDQLCHYRFGRNPCIQQCDQMKLAGELHHGKIELEG